MRRPTFTALVSLALIVVFPVLAIALPADGAYSPAEVVEFDPSRDGSVIVVDGEAVGDVLRAQGGGSWVNILGEEVGLGIWMIAEMVEEIEHLGHYKHSGDVIRVTGTLNRTCETHGGEFDVHAHDVQILSVGEPVTHPLRLGRGITGIVGLLLALGMWLRYRAVRTAF